MWFLLVLYILHGEFQIRYDPMPNLKACVAELPRVQKKFNDAVVTCVIVKSDV
jgi:hypothetical protein